MFKPRIAFTLILPGLLVLSAAHAQSERSDDREALVREIESDVRATERYTGKATLTPSVLAALRNVPRHEFVPPELGRWAYSNEALPIGEGQTISQPYVVAMMTELAGVDADSIVLEIGTGSGYQAAVLAEIAKHVYTIEIVASLGARADATLKQLGYDNVSVRIGDGYLGWPEHAPFDAIVVTAAPEDVPAPLIEQLAVGGRMVVPIGPEGGSQSLKLLMKEADGTISTRDVLPVRFVPFTRE